jgi:hypothetical protein
LPADPAISRSINTGVRKLSSRSVRHRRSGRRLRLRQVQTAGSFISLWPYILLPIAKAAGMIYLAQ